MLVPTTFGRRHNDLALMTLVVLMIFGEVGFELLGIYRLTSS